MQNNNFRHDINGLRAIAVIAVVLFHFNSSWVPGGFAGVDVFFVISGFLMTGIIFKGIENGNFSILKFYVARANRIIPALAVLCFVLLFLGWFYLTPLDYKTLSKHTATSISFLSNILYWKEAGYFDAASHKKWLLHTWSLSVEWQFYIIYPLILIFLKKFFSINTVKKLLILGTVFGFIFCVIATYKWPNPSYYLFPTRAWEMMIGGIAYLYPFRLQENRKKIVEWSGITLIIGSYFLISSENLWPGYLAMFPVLGAFLLIQANRNNSVITNNLVFQKLGTWSYSIYLWHWPIVVALYYFSKNGMYIYLGITLSIILGFFSYKFIENNLNIKDKGIKGLIIFFIIVMFINGLSLLIYFKNGIQERVPKEVIEAEFSANNRNNYHKYCLLKTGSKVKPCYINRNDIKEDPSIIIIGDSHSDASLTAVISALPLKNNGVLFLGYQNCLPIQNVKVQSTANGFACGEYNRNVFNFLKNNHSTTPILIISRTSAYIYGSQEDRIDHSKEPLAWFDKRPNSINDEYLAVFSKQYQNALCSYKNANRKVYVTYPIPGFPYNVYEKVAQNAMINNEINIFSIDKSIYYKRNLFIKNQIDNASKKCNIQIIDTTKVFCDSRKCYGNDGINSYFYDGTHLNEYGNKKMIPLFKEIFS